MTATRELLCFISCDYNLLFFQIVQSRMQSIFQEFQIPAIHKLSPLQPQRQLSVRTWLSPSVDESKPLVSGRLVSQLVLWTQSTTKNYRSAGGDFHKEISSWKEQKGKNKTGRTDWAGGVFGRIYAMRYSWKCHKDGNRCMNRLKGVGKPGWFMSMT